VICPVRQLRGEDRGGPRGHAANSLHYRIARVVNNGVTRAYTANYGDNTVSVIDVASGSPTLNTAVQTISVGNLPMDVAVSCRLQPPLCLQLRDHTVSVFNTVGDTNAPIGTISLPYEPKGLAMQPGSAYLWALLPRAD